MTVLPARPPAAVPDPELVPPALMPEPWVGWKWVRRIENGAPRWTKLPVNPHTGGGASSTDPLTWGTFAQALTRTVRHGLAGVGVVLHAASPLLGVDVDHCVDPASGEVDPVALGIWSGLGPLYSEVSPSGTGLRGFAFGQLPPGWRNRKVPLSTGVPVSVEVYDSGRYLTVTGWRLAESPPDVGAVDPTVLAAWHARLDPRADSPPPQRPAPPRTGAGVATLPDQQLLQRMFAARNGAAVRALWAGDTSGYGGDDSAADMALVSHLYFWSSGDVARTDALFRQSGLYREKWDERRGRSTYGRRTLEAVANRGGEVYRPLARPRPGGWGIGRIYRVIIARPATQAVSR
jgi:putative DNA primase/helicase